MAVKQVILFGVLLLVNACFGGQFITYSYGGRNNMLYVPTASGSRPLPVFVMLHGCTQNPTDFAAGTKMNTYAEQHNFFALYPEQPSSANMNKCWNWFEPAHQSRGSGEPKLINDMVNSLSPKYSIDKGSVFVGGLSAGAAFADIMGVTYPDMFRGVVVGAGLEYKAATSTIAALTAMTQGGPSPVTQGQVAYKAMGSYARTQLVLVVHGTADYTVYPVNGQQVVTSYAKTLDYVVGSGTSHGWITDKPTTTTPGQVPGGRAYTTNTYADSQNGNTYIKYITVTGMGHAWSGGSTSGSYTDPNGPDASLLMVQWFLNSTTTSTSTSSTTATVSTATTGTSSTTGSIATATSSTTSTISTSTTGGNGQVFTSIASEDGYVGKLVSDGFSTSVCQVGGKGGYTLDDYRTILSFDTSSLNSSTISSAVLTITRQTINGALTPLIVDIKAGTFSSNGQLTQMTYYAVPSAANIGLISIPTSDGAATSFQIPSTYFKYIQSGQSRTQFMLRQNLVTTMPSASPSILQIFDGQATLTIQ